MYELFRSIVRARTIVGIMAAGVLAACSLLDGSPSPPAPQQEPEPPAQPQTPPPPLPRRAVRPAPVEAFNPGQLIGLDVEDVKQMIGAPDAVRAASPATVWSYNHTAAACSLEIFFYMDLGSQKLRALAYDVSSTGKPGDQRTAADCAGRIRAGSRDGKR
jgi:hypothetical protein